MSWDPQQYLRFREERAQPFYDLLALLRPVAHARVADLGCGTGALTAELHRHLQARDTVGIDRSPEMLALAASLDVEGLRFHQADLRTWEGGPCDVVFSNAALHWLPDHPSLFEHLRDRLAPGGQLAVQVPANGGRPVSEVSARLAAESPFREALDGWVLRYDVLAPAAYAELLDRLGFVEQHVRMQVYTHRLPGREAVLEWMRGAHLTGYQRRLSPDLFAEFVERYRERLFERLPDDRPLFFPYQRILLWARLPAGVTPSGEATR